MVAISFKAIKPQKLKVDAISEQILYALQDEAREHKRQLDKTVSSWAKEKPKFSSLIDLNKSGDATVITGPTGAGSDKWEWLDKGTKIRWALMSRDWRSKTSPGSFASGRGSGRVVIAGRRAMQARGIGPRPGIKARGWSDQLTKQRKRPFQRRVIKAMQDGARNLF